jgi:hypothetical protein
LDLHQSLMTICDHLFIMRFRGWPFNI